MFNFVVLDYERGELVVDHWLSPFDMQNEFLIGTERLWLTGTYQECFSLGIVA